MGGEWLNSRNNVQFAGDVIANKGKASPINEKLASKLRHG